MLASLHKKNTILNLALETIKGTRRRAGYYTTIFCKDAIMAWTEKAFLIWNPTYTATQMCTDVGHCDEVLTVLGQDVD
jgi:hypothetical protein